MDNKAYPGPPAATDESHRRSHNLAEQLSDVTAKVLRFTNAGGAAIAIGTSDVAVTKATSGDLAPDLETPIRLEGSFAGLCIREGELLYCEDAENDPRVDATASAAMGLRSMVMVPIGEKGQIRGVLAAFSAVPAAFRPTHIAVLRTLADIVHELITREEGPSEPITQTMRRYEAPTQSMRAPEFEIGSEPTAPVHAEPVIAPSRPDPLPTMNAAAAPVLAPEPKVVEIPRPIPTANLELIHSPQKVETPNKATPAEEITRRIEKPIETEPAHIPEPEKKPEPSLVEAPKPKSKDMPSIVALANQAKRAEVDTTPADTNVLPAAADPILSKPGIGATTKMLSTPTKSSAPAKPKHETKEPATGSFKASSTDAFDAPSFKGLDHTTDEPNPVLKYVAIAALGVAMLAGAVWGVRAFVRRPVTPATTTTVESTTAKPDSGTSNPAGATSPAPVQATNGPAQTTRPPAPTSGTNASVPSKPDTKPPETKSSTPEKKPVIVSNKVAPIPGRGNSNDVDAPQVALNSGGASLGALLNSKSATTPTLNVKRSVLSPPEVIHRVPPRFPEFARRTNPAGDRVVLNVTVGKDGRVGNVQVVRGQSMFSEAAVNAVKQWQYRPAFLNGEAVEATVEVVISFTNGR